MTICSRPPLISSTPTRPAHFHAAAAGLEIILDALDAADACSRSENPGPLMNLHQLVDRDVRIVDLRADAVDDFAEIVRRHVRGHADGDAGAAVDEQIRKRGRENRRLGARLVVVRDEIDRVLVHVLHQRGAEMGQARLGVTHGRRRIAFDGAEIALAIDQPLAHRPRLRHVDERRVNRPLRRADGNCRIVSPTDLRALAVLAAREQRRDRASRKGCGAAKA